MANFCKNCGAQLEEGAGFCPGCGTVTGAPQGQYAPPPPQPQYAPPPGQQPQGQYAPPQGQYAPPQGQQPQGQYAPPPGPGYAPQQPKKKKLPRWLLVVIIIAAVLVVVLVVANAATGKAADRDYFRIGADEVPSVKLVLGEEREVSGVKTGTNAVGREMVINYKVDEGQGEDMGKYAKALMDDYGYINTTPYDFTGPKGKGFEFAKESVMEGYVVLVQIDYDTKGYDLTLTVSTGELIVDGPPDDPAGPDEPDEPNEPDDPDGPGVDDPDTGQAEPEPPVVQDGMVEILVPAEFFFGVDKDGLIEEARYTGFESVENSDGSLTLIMTEVQQDAFVREHKTHIDDMVAVYTMESQYNVKDIQISDDYSEVTVMCGEGFETYGSLGNNAIVTLGYWVPLHRIYQGKGPDSTTKITLVYVGTGEVMYVMECPYELHDYYDW
ncbi:MAG: zinc ribbon domain-containing protein [Clostridiales bacterium]|nr:zinc ribbon domain-containing protein [Clostridiales bacterium]